MQINKKSGLALVLIALGVLTLLNGFGFIGGSIMGILIPLAIMVLGYIGIRHGKSLLGWSLFIIGFIILLGKFSGLIGLIISLGLIFYGLSLFKKSKNAY
jgi:lia operon protein LiaI